MKLLEKHQRTFVSLVLTCALTALFAAAQDMARVNSADLNLVRMGHIKTKGGHVTLFRLYKALDGTEGQVHFTEFDSLEPAEVQIEKWVKRTRTVTSRDHNQIKGDRLVSDRVLAIAGLPRSETKEFVIIRRDYLKCYLIESMSLQVALQVEDLLDHK